MADEITSTVSVSAESGSLKVTIPRETATYDMTTANYASGVQSVGTSAE